MTDSSKTPADSSSTTRSASPGLAKIVMYRSSYCPYCVYAKRLLDSKGLAFEEINIETDPALMEEMLERSGGRRTVPQIFVGDVHVGGYDDLAALDAAGKLDELVATSS